MNSMHLKPLSKAQLAKAIQSGVFSMNNSASVIVYQRYGYILIAMVFLAENTILEILQKDNYNI